MVWSALRFQVVFPSFPVLHIFVTHSEARGSEKQKHVAAAGVQSSLITCSNSWQITCEQEQLSCCRCLDAPARPRRCWSHVFSTTERNDFKQPWTPPVHVWAWVLDSDRCELFVFVLSVPQQTAGRLRALLWFLYSCQSEMWLLSARCLLTVCSDKIHHVSSLVDTSTVFSLATQISWNTFQTSQTPSNLTDRCFY